MQTKKILVVDDSSTARHVLFELLAKEGYQVLTATNGDEAIIKSKSELPDLILMDVVMPGMNGFRATRAITKDEATQHIPVLLLSSKDMETDRIWGMRQGAREFINKPFVTADLLARISAYLAEQTAGSLG